MPRISPRKETVTHIFLSSSGTDDEPEHEARKRVNSLGSTAHGEELHLTVPVRLLSRRSLRLTRSSFGQGCTQAEAILWDSANESDLELLDVDYNSEADDEADQYGGVVQKDRILALPIRGSPVKRGATAKGNSLAVPRPAGRWWFDHVEVPTPGHPKLVKMTGSHKSGWKPPVKSGNGGQKSLLSYFSSPTTSSTASSSSNIIRPRQPRKISNAAPLDIDDSSGPVTSSSNTSEYNDTNKEWDGTTSDFIPSDGELELSSPESDEPISDDASDAFIDETPVAHKSKRQKTIFGSSLNDEEKEVVQVRSRKGVSVAKTAARNRDGWQYKGGINEAFPPMSNLTEIFDDITSTSVKKGLNKVVRHLASRKLRVATMCSGTESPVLALDLISESLQKHHGLKLEYEHVFSAEIVPYKQAYIERNFSPPVIFRDIRELIDSEYATTAYGASVKVPTGIDMLIAGFSCVDFSNLNYKKRDLEATGESGDTFRAVYNYAKMRRPTLIVLENVCSAPWEKLKQSWTEADYEADFLRLDTKQYYLPHTRLRGYMVCIDRRKTANAEKMARDWVHLMGDMRRPVSSSIEAFLLDEDDPRVHRGRAELSKGAHGGDKGPRDVDWTKCQGRHQDYRADLSLGSKRPLTGWEDNGSCRMPDYAWADWGTKQVERIWDTFEISFLRNVRRGYDSQYKTRVWELSQNIDRFTDTTPFGITGCVTPTGSPFLTNRGGLMIGLESLSMQGLPIEKLLLTRETQKQLQDLAGNAMSATVVGTAMMGALILGFKALQEGDASSMNLDMENVVKVSSAMEGEDKLTCHPLDLGHVEAMGLDTILADAKRGSRLCLCEGRTMMTNNKLRRCKFCGHTTCEKCGGTPTHRYESIPMVESVARISPMAFENQLKDALPMTTKLGGLNLDAIMLIKAHSGLDVSEKNWKVFAPAVAVALDVELRFHSLKRGQTWTVYYDAPTARMELVLNPHMAEWRIFAKPDRREPGNSLARATLSRPFARMRPNRQSLIQGTWQFCLPATHIFQASVQGEGNLRPSWEANLGLQEPKFADRKVWSQLKISVQSEDVSRLDMDISGTYDLLPDCGTASGSLHKQRVSEDETPVFLFLDPSRLGNPTDDYFVFSPEIGRLNYGEMRSTIAKIDPKWKPSSAESAINVICKVDGQWVDIPQAAFEEVVTNQQAIFAIPPSTLPQHFLVESCEAANIMLSCRVPLPHEEDVGWCKGDWVEVSKLNERQTFLNFAWLTERVRRIDGLGDWKALRLQHDGKRCERCAPRPPQVRWKLVGPKDKLIPYEDTAQAAPYEHALKNRPAPFVTQARIDEDNVGHMRIGLNVWSLMHRALANLPTHGSMKDVELKWRLTTDYVPPPKLSFPKYKLLSNKDDERSEQPPGFKCKLRIEQQRSAKWMVEQESDSALPFVEEEIEEALLPQLGWRAEACATIAVPIRGGVLADQVGYGKTAITLGLIAIQFPKERKRELVHIPGKISLRATLVIVPNTLVDQWTSEVKKFLGHSLKVVAIRGQINMTNLTIEQFQSADIVVTTWNIFNNETYLSKLAQFAALPEMPASSGRAFDAWYSYATSRCSAHVEVLRDSGAETLRKKLKEELAATEKNEELRGDIPSKRLRGKAYRDALEKKAANGKRGLSDIQDSDLDVGVLPASRKAEKAVPDPFHLSHSHVKQDWRKMTCPLFQMFHWNRVVIDEYTYVAGKEHVCTTSLSANSRWVLSGTPPLEDFADVKSISVFLGIKLGIDDDAIGFIKAQTIKTLQKERTAVEQFHAFKQVHSPAWHERRNTVAQRFLDQFVRQNTAEIGEIPYEEHLCPIVLPAAERAIYLELHSHLMSQDMKIRQGKSRADSDRVRRLNQTLGASKTAEEALVKRCSHFTLDNLDSVRENATKACDSIVVERERQLKELESELRRNLRHAAWLRKFCKDNDMHYAGWKKNVASNVFGDEPATIAISELINHAESHSDPSHEAEFYMELCDKAKRDKRRDKKSSARKAQGKKSSKRRPSRRCRSDSLLDDSSGCTSDVSADSENGDNRPARLTSSAQKVQALRDLAGQLRRLSTEYVSRRRSLRFFKVVRELQTAYSSNARDGDTASGEVFTCSRCERVDLPRETISVLTLCGHTACDECRATHAREDECIVSTCNAAARSFHIVRAAELGEEDIRAGEGRHYGRKLEEVVALCQRIPKDEQILLFVQFNDLLEQVSDALTDSGVKNVALTESNRQGASTLMNQFQTERDDRKKKKVLILNVANESASGANLTNANHIIFLSPFLLPTQYHYDSTETQAIGRARRYGQQKMVHIYRFFSLKTIDVEILEQRTKKRLVKVTGFAKNGGFRLLDPASMQAEIDAEGGWGGGNSLAKWGLSESE